MKPETGLFSPATLGERRREVAVFLFLIVPPMIVGYFSGTRQEAFGLFAVSAILTDFAFVALVLFFLWRNDEPPSRCGLGGSGAAREILIGALLYPPISGSLALLESVFQRVGLSAPPQTTPRFLAAHGGWQLALAAALVLVVAIAEEILFRGYLLLRFGEILRSASRAVVLSAVVFSLGHLYEGTAGALAVMVMGMALGAIRIWRRSLIAPMVIHLLQDLFAIVIIPAMHG